MIKIEELRAALDKMILSASGWRGVFGEDEESAIKNINDAAELICAAAAFVFAGYLKNLYPDAEKTVLLGTDTRPTGKEMADAMIPVLLACGMDVRYAGVTAAPEIMAWARAFADGAAGFIYISASHNPIGYNGIKFGLTDGGVLAAEETEKLIGDFRAVLNSEEGIERIKNLKQAADPAVLQNVYGKTARAKKEAYKTYFDFCAELAFSAGAKRNMPCVPQTFGSAFLRENIRKKPLGIVCDFNGSARAVSVDAEFFSSCSLVFDCINVVPGQIAHKIVPEGESLEPCRLLLEEAHERDNSFLIGYVPDCDGDRGNLVIWDEAAKKARALEAQEVFALCCTAELSQLVFTGELSYDDGGKALSKAAIVVNDATSMRIDRIAQAFGVSVFRAEVGEANVVGLARRLREEDYIVRILGEGSNGGNIIHPSAVRDPIHTVMAIVKLLTVRGQGMQEQSKEHRAGLFEIWCKLSGQMDKYKDDFSLSDIIASLPQFVTTAVSSPEAVLRIKTKDHALLKERYEKVFRRRWEEQKDELKAKFGICGWAAASYKGIEERRNIKNFCEALRGGLKILFFDGNGNETAFLWMRGSATEPVFRIMADVSMEQAEPFLLNWQREMIVEADNETIS